MINNALHVLLDELGLRRKAEICTHIAAVILYREYSKLIQPIYAAVLTMECIGDYHIEVLDKEVKVVKQVRALSNDLLNRGTTRPTS